jgi:hypothetical protein
MINYKFRKKPVVVEAFQMTLERRWNNVDWPEWLNKAWNEGNNSLNALQISKNDPEKNILEIVTLEGNQTVSWGDWIIRGVNGELFPCKPFIFEQIYESCEDDSEDDSEPAWHLDDEDDEDEQNFSIGQMVRIARPDGDDFKNFVGCEGKLNSIFNTVAAVELDGGILSIPISCLEPANGWD